MSPILVTIIPANFNFFVTNFGENVGDLKKLVIFLVTKISPILVTIIPSKFGFFNVTNFGENLSESLKISIIKSPK